MPEPVAETSASAEGMRADEGEPIAHDSDNPFVRDGRGPRGPRGRNSDRRIGRRDENDAPRPDTSIPDNSRPDNSRPVNARPDNAHPDMQRKTARRERVERVAESAPLFDPSILPPAIGIRSDSVVEAPARPERTRASKATIAVAAPVAAVAAPVAEEAAVAPKKRGRPRKNPLPEAQVDAES